MPFPRNLGAILLEAWRRERGFTQFKAAIHLEIDPSPLSKYERGEKRPGRVLAVRISERSDGAVPVDAWDKEAAEVVAEEESTPPVVE